MDWINLWSNRWILLKVLFKSILASETTFSDITILIFLRLLRWTARSLNPLYFLEDLRETNQKSEQIEFLSRFLDDVHLRQIELNHLFAYLTQINWWQLFLITSIKVEPYKSDNEPNKQCISNLFFISFSIKFIDKINHQNTNDYT